MTLLHGQIAWGWSQAFPWAIETPILEIVQAYIRHRVMPADPAGDALHLATRLLSPLRVSSDLELQAPGQCEQVWSHPPSQYFAWAVDPCARYAAGIAGRYR